MGETTSNPFGDNPIRHTPVLLVSDILSPPQARAAAKGDFVIRTQRKGGWHYGFCFFDDPPEYRLEQSAERAQP